MILEEKRRRARDVHLNFIVDQTQKYSTWLMQGLNPPVTPDPPLTAARLPSGKIITSRHLNMICTLNMYCRRE